MTVCRFFQQGNCKFGSDCRFEHPGASSNPFGPLSSNNTNNGNQSIDSKLEKYLITTDVIEKDLTSERPTWILSAYGPGRGAPDQLFGGLPREQSTEEVRLVFYEARSSGNEQTALNTAQQMYAQAEDQMQNAARNSRQAALFIVEGEGRHPNRFDVCNQGTQGQPFGVFEPSKTAQANPFGSTSNNASNPFGSTSTGTSPPFNSNSNTNSNAFGTASTSGSAFGQASALGQKPNPFGAPSQLSSGFGTGAKPSSGFGSSSQPAAGASPFGQPTKPANPFGAPAQPATGFGQAPTPTSAFGQTSALGAKPNPFGSPAFGQTSQPAAQGSAFGQTGQLGAKPNPFGSAPGTGANPFSSTAAANKNEAAVNPFASNANSGNGNASPFATAGGNNTPTANPFGTNKNNITTTTQANPFGSSNPQTNTGTAPFGQPAPNKSVFGQTSAPAPAANPFGTPPTTSSQAASNPFSTTRQPSSGAEQPNPFGQQKINPFASPSTTAPTQPNPFGQPSQPAQQAATSAAVKSTGNPYPPGSGKEHPPVDQYATKGMDGRLATFKGKTVSYKDGKPGYKDFTGPWTRIWFPEGPPIFNSDTALKAEEYDGTASQQWQAFEQAGIFAGGVMPLLPPPREACRWDF